MSERLRAADFDDLPEGTMRRVEAVGDHGVLVCRVKGVLYAIDDNCSHRDARLSEGRLRHYEISCPLHGAQFDVRTGEPKGPPAPCAIRCWSFDS